MTMSAIPDRARQRIIFWKILTNQVVTINVTIGQDIKMDGSKKIFLRLVFELMLGTRSLQLAKSVHMIASECHLVSINLKTHHRDHRLVEMDSAKKQMNSKI